MKIVQPKLWFLSRKSRYAAMAYSMLSILGDTALNAALGQVKMPYGMRYVILIRFNKHIQSIDAI